MSKNEELLTRNYDISDIEEDPRFITCRKEFIRIVFICLSAIAILGFTLYGVDWGPVQEYTYILGLPAWVSITGLAQFALVVVIAIGINKLVKDDSLDDVIE